MNDNNNNSTLMNGTTRNVVIFPDMSSHVQTQADENPQNHSSHVETSQDKARFTLTVEQVVERFAQANLPRSARSIARWCQQGVLEHARVDTEKNFKFLIDPISVDRRITELKQAKAVTNVDEVITSHVETKDEVAEKVTSHVQTAERSSQVMSGQKQLERERETPTHLEVIHLNDRERDLLERMLADRDDQIRELKIDKDDMRAQIKLEREMRQREQELHMEQVRLLAASDRDTKGVTKTIANLFNNIWPGTKGASNGEQPIALTTVIHDVENKLGGEGNE